MYFKKFTDFNEVKITLKREDPFKTNVLLQTESTKVLIINIQYSKYSDKY